MTTSVPVTCSETGLLEVAAGSVVIDDETLSFGAASHQLDFTNGVGVVRGVVRRHETSGAIDVGFYHRLAGSPSDWGDHVPLFQFLRILVSTGTTLENLVLETW